MSKSLAKLGTVLCLLILAASRPLASAPQKSVERRGDNATLNACTPQDSMTIVVSQSLSGFLRSSDSIAVSIQ